MTTVRTWMGMMVLAAALAGCGGQGGELAEDTARRRAEASGADSLPADSAQAADEEPGRMPAFVRTDSTPVAIPAAPAGTDTTPAAAPTPAPGPQQAWTAGVTDRVRTVPAPVVLNDVRVAVNDGFDRMVLEFAGPSVPGYRVEYAGEASQCGSGDPVRVVTMRGTQAHTERGQATVQPRRRRLEMPVLREYEFSCDFEGVVQVVLGVSARNRYRVLELQNPARLVVDLQQ
jgi:hypothetical protein